MFYPLVQEVAADGIPVAVTCRVLNLARQPYYRWLKNPITAAEVAHAYRANALFDAHRDEPEFGLRLLADEARTAGQPMADRTAWRITSANGWWSSFGKKKSKNGKRPGSPVHDHLCAQVDEHGRTRHDFATERPDELWLTDITEHKTPRGQGLHVCDQGRALRRDRRACDRERGGDARRLGRMRRGIRPGKSVPQPQGAARPGPLRLCRIHGAGRCSGRQRGDGIVLRVAAEEHP